MFLIRRLEAVRQAPERGAALAAVLGLMALFLVFASLITASVVGAYGVTSATRSGVQSGAAADSGIAVARAGLYVTGNCAAQPTPGTYSSSAAPTYIARIEYFAAGTWHAGCPTSATTQVRITSRGLAQAQGVNGATVGDKTTVEAVLNYTPGTQPVSIQPSGTALYLYKGGSVEANASFITTGSPGAGIMVKDGDLACDKNNSEILGNVYVVGNLSFADTGQACKISGNAWVAKMATLGKGYISGNLTAAAVSPTSPKSSGNVGGTYTQSSSIPPVPKWTEIGYDPASWSDSAGTAYPVKPVSTAADCDVANSTFAGLIDLGTPVIINALECPDGLTASKNTTIALTSDVVIYANKFDFTPGNSNVKLTFDSSNSTGHRIWFITPDADLTDGGPTCDVSKQGGLTAKNNFSVTNPVSALLYTPCSFEGNNGFNWRGQIIAGKPSQLMNNPSFTFVQMGVAGVNLDTGEATPKATVAQPGTVVSNREVTG